MAIVDSNGSLRCSSKTQSAIVLSIFSLLLKNKGQDVLYRHTLKTAIFEKLPSGKCKAIDK
jgi:hypothetical protein